jgi:hypothetical protein
MPTAATVDELVNHLLNAQTATSPVTITLTGSNYDLSTYSGALSIPTDTRFGTADWEKSNLPHIKKNVTINVASGVATITRSGAKRRHFYVEQTGQLTLHNLMLTNGDVGIIDTGGGAINNDGILNVYNCRFTANKSNYGGAILNLKGQANIFNCDIYQNEADCGGGLYNYLVSNNCVMTVKDSRIASNLANESWAQGGGIMNFGTLTLEHCMVTQNSASNAGGIGNWDAAGQVTIKKSHITFNNAGNGGGVYNNAGTMQIDESTLVGNTATSGAQAYQAGGSLSINRTSLPDNYAAGNHLVGVTPTTPLQEWKPNFVMAGGALASLVPTYQYNGAQAGARAIQLSRDNFVGFPQDSVSSVVGYIDISTTRGRRDYSSILFHDNPTPTNPRTGSALFISEMIHYGGVPMTIEPADDPNNPDCSAADQSTPGPYTAQGWRYCSTEKNSTYSWKYHPAVIAYFDALPGGNANPPVTRNVTLTQIQTVIRTDETAGFDKSGTLKGDPNNPSDPIATNFTAMKNRFVSGDLNTVAAGDYLYMVSHGFIVVGWGPFLGTIDGITYALTHTLSPTRTATDCIPYVADFCYGTTGTPDSTGWLQDPRARPFYAVATRVFHPFLLADQLPNLKKRVVTGLSTTPVPVYDNFAPTSGQWEFHKIPATISEGVLPLNRLFFRS